MTYAFHTIRLAAIYVARLPDAVLGDGQQLVLGVIGEEVHRVSPHTRCSLTGFPD